MVSGNEPSSALPGVPSAKQAGIPEFQLSTWSAIFAPKGTPKDVVAKLAGALDKALDDPAVAKRIVDLGGSVPAKADRGPAHLAEVLKADIASWHPTLQAAMAEPRSSGAQSLARISATSTRRPSRADRMPARMTASEVVA